MPKKTAVTNFSFLVRSFLVCFIGSVLSLVAIQYLFQTAFPLVGYRLDTSWLEAVYSLRTPFLNNTMFFITLFGADFTILLGGIIVLLFQRIHRRRESFIFVGALVFGLVLNTFLKYLFHRLRPDIAPLIVEHSYSYPSTHAMNAFIFYGLLAYYIIVFTKKELLEIAIAVFSISMIILVGLSRVYLGVHYPTDVLAGYLAGFWVVGTVVYINKLLSRTHK